MIHVVLVEPEVSGNIGAVARAMKNFGFSNLILVNPKCRVDEEARNRAKHAQEVLKKAVDFLKSVQVTGSGEYDGCFRFKESIPTDRSKEMALDEDLAWMYGHAIATMAVGELLALSGDQLGLARCVEDAGEFG